MVCMDAQHTKHATYKLAYHFVWCPRIAEKESGGQVGYVYRIAYLSGPLTPDEAEHFRKSLTPQE